MKKKITRPDGTIEEIEGTAEELALFERQIREEGSKEKKGKKILNEEQTLKMMRDLLDKEKPGLPIVPTVTTTPWWQQGLSTPWITYSDKSQGCLIDAFFKQNPNEKFCMIACPCPKCSVYCVSGVYASTSVPWVEGVQFVNNGVQGMTLQN